MKHFKPYELVSRKVYLDMKDDCLSLFELEALQMLDDFHEFMGTIVTVNNWFWSGNLQHRGARSVDEQLMINPGHPHGMHVYDLEHGIKCKAFDLDVSGYDADEIRTIILDNKDHPLLSRIQRMETKISWVHMDCGPLSNGVGRIQLFGA
jgi:hypothetical protein